MLAAIGRSLLADKYDLDQRRGDRVMNDKKRVVSGALNLVGDNQWQDLMM
jgi:hypothetical protein